MEVRSWAFQTTGHLKRAWQIRPAVEEKPGRLINPVVSDQATEALFDFRMTRHRGLPAIVRVSIDIVLYAVALQIAVRGNQLPDKISSSHAISTAMSLL